MSTRPHRFKVMARVRLSARKCRRRCTGCEQIRKQLAQRRSRESGLLVYVCGACEALLDARGWLL